VNPSSPDGKDGRPEREGREREALVIVHHHPGRIRVRAETFRYGTAAIDLVRAKLEALPGILRVTHSARSGSMLVEYEPGHAEPDAILGGIAEAAGLDRAIDEREARRRDPGPGLVAVEVVKELNAITHELTGWRADLRVMVPTALVGLAAVSFAVSKEPRLPRWDNLLYWSYNIFSVLHRRDIERLEQAVEKGVGASAPSSIRTP
jgi:hypothetical protein